MNLFETIFHVLHLGTFTCDEIFFWVKGKCRPLLGRKRKLLGLLSSDDKILYSFIRMNLETLSVGTGIGVPASSLYRSIHILLDEFYFDSTTFVVEFTLEISRGDSVSHDGPSVSKRARISKLTLFPSLDDRTIFNLEHVFTQQERAGRCRRWRSVWSSLFLNRMSKSTLFVFTIGTFSTHWFLDGSSLLVREFTLVSKLADFTISDKLAKN
jgi:hypothetical protein